MISLGVYLGKATEQLAALWLPRVAREGVGRRASTQMKADGKIILAIVAIHSGSKALVRRFRIASWIHIGKRPSELGFAPD